MATATKMNQRTFRNRLPDLAICGKPCPVEVDMQSKNAALIVCNALGIGLVCEGCFKCNENIEYQ